MILQYRAYVFRRLYWLLVLLVAIGVSSILVADALAQGSTVDRRLEPVIIKGGLVRGLLGEPIQQVFVYSYSNGIWYQIPSQIDEISDGNYVSIGDGSLNSADEIVFMSGDLGMQFSGSLVISGSLLVESDWYEVEVTDPTTNKQGWAYLFHSTSLSQTNSLDYVNFNLGMQRVVSNNYEVGLAVNHAGIDYLTLNGGNDILDRFKLRASVKFGILEFPPISENDLGNPEAGLIKDGSVRVIFQQIAERDVTIGVSTNEVGVRNIYQAYGAMMQTSASTSFTLTKSGVNLKSVRTSFDLNSSADGSKFYNANTELAGVTVDGVLDIVDATPVSPWNQISHTSGRVIQITDATSVGGKQSNYYCDDASATTEECDSSIKTGDDASYGDFGYLIEGDINRTSVLTNTMFILPATDINDNVGERYNTYIEQPLTVRISASSAVKEPNHVIYIPILVK